MAFVIGSPLRGPLPSWTGGLKRGNRRAFPIAHDPRYPGGAGRTRRQAGRVQAACAAMASSHAATSRSITAPSWPSRGKTRGWTSPAGDPRMHETANATSLFDLIVLLATAVVAVPLSKRLGLGSVLGYIAAGIAIGPSALGLFSEP